MEVSVTKPIKSMSKKELCTVYKIPYKRLRKWLAPIADKLGEYIGGEYTPKQCVMIYEFLGYP